MTRNGADEIGRVTAGSTHKVSGESVLTVERVNKWFHRGSARENHVLKNVSFEVRRGEVLVVIGPSGSGKSTLLRCINFIAPPDTGSITFLDRHWSIRSKPRFNVFGRFRYQRDLAEMRSRIGLVFQHFNLFPHMDALRNISLALVRVKHMSWRKARVVALKELERVGLADKAHAYPSQLSGGQKQRVAIARALAMNPSIMLFDEITSALDPELIGGILQEVRRLADEGMTMIVVTHEMRFARDVGDRVIFMEAGEVVEEGPARSLITNPTNARTREFLSAIL